MTYVVSISEFRKNLFEYADLVAEDNEVVVERNGKSVFKVILAKDDPKERAEKLMFLLKKYIKGPVKIDKKADRELNEFMRGKKEIEYMKNLDKR